LHGTSIYWLTCGLCDHVWCRTLKG
jgi:hypothetical protein